MQTHTDTDAGRTIRRGEFLRDVLICSLGAYGGPEAHYGVFTDQMVIKKKYLTEEELVELIALSGILPGPSSTQTIAAIGYKTGGPVLALLTLAVWALPVLCVMTLLSFSGSFMEQFRIPPEVLRFIGPAAVGFIITAAYRIGRKVVKNKTTFFILAAAAVLSYFCRQPWVYPALLAAGGFVTAVSSRENNMWNKTRINPPWFYLIIFAAFAAGSLFLTFVWDNTIVHLFESFYRYGYLVIGGGQVVVPLMYSELVEVRQYMTNQEFLTGFGLVQGLPGPMFSFSAYAGGMAARGGGTLFQILGAAAGGIGIFLPGILLVFFVYPVWENLKQIKAVKLSLAGITACAGGLVAASSVLLMQKNGFTLENIIVSSLTAAALFSKKIPAPLIIISVLAAGFLLPA